jgi:tagatose 1,6-diphosphate aldolase
VGPHPDLNIEEHSMAKMTTAERRGYRQICDATGAMMVVACDQRGGMRSVLAPTPEEQGRITNATLGDTKADIAVHLAAKAGCVLVDPICAVPSLVDDDILPRDTALLIGIDASGWDETDEGHRISKMVEGVNARRVRELGATGGKIMIYLRMDHEPANTQNLATLDDVVEDFAREDLLLVVEFLTYPLKGESKEEYAQKLPKLVQDATRACVEHGAKVLKLPYPGSPESCARVTEIAGETPWAVLSAGVDHETFLGQVEAAMSNGASGVIAGRSLWKDCVSLDRQLSRERLSTVAVSRLRDLQAIVARFMAKADVAA